MNPSNLTFVISRFSRNTEWTQQLVHQGYNVCMYDHGNPNNPYNIVKNVGKESIVFLQYIVDHYDYLNKYTFFLHDEDYAWHHKGHVIDLVNDEVKESRTLKGRYPKFKNINNRCCRSITSIDWFPSIKKWFDKYYGPYIGKHEKYLDWTYGEQCCAQFVVHRDRIRQHPKKMYQDLLRWMYTTKLDSEESARYLEWTWRLLFDNPFKNRGMTTQEYKNNRKNALTRSYKNCRLI